MEISILLLTILQVTIIHQNCISLCVITPTMESNPWRDFSHQMKCLLLITCLFWKEENQNTKQCSRNTAKLVLKKSLPVSTTGQHNKYLLQSEETRKQEERTKINLFPHLAPLFQLIPTNPEPTLSRCQQWKLNTLWQCQQRANRPKG